MNNSLGDLADFFLVITLIIGVLVVIGGVAWLWGKVASLSQGEEVLPKSVGGRDNGHERLLREIEQLAQEDIDYELSTVMPTYEMKALFDLDGQKLRTSGDVRRWRNVHEHAIERLRRIDQLLATKREQYALTEPAGDVPEFLRPQDEISPKEKIR